MVYKINNTSLFLESNRKFSLRENYINDPSDDECTIKVSHCGVCSSDILRSGFNKSYHYPLVMGHEFSGIIEKIGKNVKSFNVGDHVTIFPLLPCFDCEFCKINEYVKCKNYSYYGSRTDGAYSTRINVKSWNIVKIPNTIDLKDACFVEPMSVAVHTIDKINFTKKDRLKILIIGAGFICNLMIQILHKNYKNIEIICIDRNQSKLDFINKYVTKTFCTANSNEWSLFSKEYKNFFDITIEGSGSPEMYKNSINFTNANGDLIWMNNIDNDLILKQSQVSEILRKELNIIGVWNSFFKKNDKDDWEKTLKLIEDGIKPSDLVSHWTTLSQLPELLNKVYDHKDRKVLFKFNKIAINLFNS